MQQTTTRTTVVTELPDERRWQGRDWIKALIAGGLALALLRPGAQAPAALQPTAAVVASPIPAVVATLAPTIAPTVAPAAAVAAPQVLSTREAVLAGPYTVQGRGEPGSTVEVLVNGVSIGTAPVGADGTWSLETTLEAGEAEIVARAVDAGGAVLAEADPVSLNVAEAPGGASGAGPAVTIDAPGDDLISGPVVLSGTTDPGAIVEVLVNGVSVGTTTAGADGTWSLETTLEAGEAEIVARVVDAGGAVLAEADPVSLNVAEAPGDGAAAVTAPSLDPPGGDLSSGPAVLTGRGLPGSLVRVIIGGVDAGTVPVNPDGTWSIDAILTEGEQEVVVEAVDASGATIASADPVRITVGGGGGAATVVTPAEGAELPSGPITVSGTGAPGAVLEILNGDQVLGETTVGADGTWSAEVPVGDGSVSISVREKGSDQILARPVRVTVGGAGAVGPACTTIAVGCEAWVTRAGGLVLRMRSSGAILPDNIIARLPIGTQMTVLEGPAPADGQTWWRVRTIGGNEGWVSGENLVLQPD
ncbi:MAG: hypothetical protein OHK0015_47690 [Chloroflexi bacterium OHK40]